MNDCVINCARNLADYDAKTADRLHCALGAEKIAIFFCRDFFFLVLLDTMSIWYGDSDDHLLDLVRNTTGSSGLGSAGVGGGMSTTASTASLTNAGGDAVTTGATLRRQNDRTPLLRHIRYTPTRWS